MRANRIQFKICNIAIAFFVTFMLWLFFGHHVPGFIFLIPFFWILQARATHSRLHELHDRMIMNTELLVAMMQRHPDFDFEAYLEDNNLLDDDDDNDFQRT